MEGLIHDEVIELLDVLGKDLGQEFMISNLFNIAVVNALWTIMTGKRHNLDDKVRIIVFCLLYYILIIFSSFQDLLFIVNKLDEFMSSNNEVSVLNVFPRMRHIAPQMTGWNTAKDMNYAMINFIKSFIQSHVEKHDSSLPPNDLIDVFLNKIEESDKETQSRYKYIFHIRNFGIQLCFPKEN